MCLPCTRQHESNLREGSQLKEISTLVRRKYRQEEKGRKKKNKREKARKGVWSGLILERKQGSVYLTTSCFPITLTKERAQEIALILGQLLLPVSRELLPIIPYVRASAAAVTEKWGGGAVLINQGCQRQAKRTHRYQICKGLFFKVLTFCLLFLKVSITRVTHFC